MAFVKKTWKDRIAEFPTRRRLTKEDNTSELVTVAREEGTLSQEGDAFSAENMNDLENRIDAEFTEVNGKLNNYQNIESKLIWEAGLRPSHVTAYKKGREVFISFQCAVTINKGIIIPIFKVPYTIKVDVFQPMTVSDGIGTPLGSCNGIMATDSYFKIASPINGGYLSGTVQFLIDDE